VSTGGELFEDVENDPLWRMAGLLANAPPRPVRGYVTVSLEWLGRVLPVVHSADQLLVAMALYRQCLLTRSRTVALANGELAALGISRQTKYRALAWLRGAGAIAIEETASGRPGRVTLLWFP
jgi:hypothetical protein